MKTVGVVTFLSLLVTLGTGRPGKHFLVETEDEDTGSEVARFNARFNAPNVEEYEGKVWFMSVSILRDTLASLASEMSSSSIPIPYVVLLVL